MSNSDNESMVFEKKLISEKWNEILIQIWKINCKENGEYFELREVFNFEHLGTWQIECSSCFDVLKQKADEYQLEDVEFTAVELWGNLI